FSMWPRCSRTLSVTRSNSAPRRARCSCGRTGTAPTPCSFLCSGCLARLVVMPVRVNPSILSADFVNMEAELGRIANADLVHVDVMDNHFVPNLTFGPQMVGRIQDVSPIPLDVHLMIEDPDRWAPGYAELGAYSVTFHAEAAGDAVALARRLREIGSRAGIAVK